MEAPAWLLPGVPLALLALALAFVMRRSLRLALVNLRGLAVRRAATAMTVGGIGLVVMVLVLVWAMSAGLTRVFTLTGDPSNLLVLRQGSKAETTSWIPRAQFSLVSSVPGVDLGPDGKPLASGELLIIINQTRRGSSESANVIVRGVTPAGFSFRPELEIVEGRAFVPGAKEILASRGLASRFQDCGLGETLVMRNTPYRIVGVFTAEHSPYESELWTDAIDLGETYGRPGYSSALLKVSDPLDRARVAEALKTDPRLSSEVVDQKSYFAAQTESAGLINVLGSLMTAFLSVGACFSAANTMYATVLARTREIGTLRALGFRRRAILLSYVVEAVVLSLLAGLFGIALGALVLLFYSGYSGTVNWVTFSEVAFRLEVTPFVIGLVLVLSAVIGAVGGFLPALRAARMPIVEALRAG